MLVYQSDLARVRRPADHSSDQRRRWQFTAVKRREDKKEHAEAIAIRLQVLIAENFPYNID